jgi:pimeloyl-ACP methyl ester carboxylesterase
MDRFPIVYVRGYAGPTASIDTVVDDPFYGFNSGATHVRVGGDGDPMFYQFEGPLLRLMSDENYRLLVRGDQHQYLLDAGKETVPKESLWVYRFYDQAATTFVPQPHENVIGRLFRRVHQQVTADGFDIESSAAGLYDLIMLIRLKTGAAKIYLVAHSMGGLVARCMMQKICLLPDATGRGREPAPELVAKFFTYGTPHGGIAFQLNALDWTEQAFGPAGSDIFAPEKMYGYLDRGATFGQLPPRGSGWDPQVMPESAFDAANVFCLIGTDPKDYGLSRVVVGPKSDGLVLIEHAYVRGAHRAFVYKSHSGTYGEVNSEEGYQNLRRFLFGRWRVRIDLDGLPAYPAGHDTQWPVWQADMRLAIRGLSVVISEQLAAHWCPIQLNEEIQRLGDTPDHPVPLVSTFLLDPARAATNQPLAAREGQNTVSQNPPHDGRMRYTLTLRVFKLDERNGSFRFADHLEQVPDWADSLIVDVGPDEAGNGLSAWTAWNSEVEGVNDQYDPITDGLPAGQQHPTEPTREGVDYVCRVPLPAAARALPVLGENASIKISVHDRRPASAQPARQADNG